MEPPAQESNGARPNSTMIWGSSDHDVLVGTFGGVLYHWDGEVWTQHDPGLCRPIGCVRGRAADDVYAVGHGSTIPHFDGERWRVLDDPDGTATGDTLTGIVFLPGGNVLIRGKSRGGRVLRGPTSLRSTVAALTVLVPATAASAVMATVLRRTVGRPFARILRGSRVAKTRASAARRHQFRQFRLGHPALRSGLDRCRSDRPVLGLGRRPSGR